MNWIVQECSKLHQPGCVAETSAVDVGEVNAMTTKHHEHTIRSHIDQLHIVRTTWLRFSLHTLLQEIAMSVHFSIQGSVLQCNCSDPV